MWVAAQVRALHTAVRALLVEEASHSVNLGRLLGKLQQIGYAPPGHAPGTALELGWLVPPGAPKPKLREVAKEMCAADETLMMAPDPKGALGELLLVYRPPALAAPPSAGARSPPLSAQPAALCAPQPPPPPTEPMLAAAHPAPPPPPPAPSARPSLQPPAQTALQRLAAQQDEPTALSARCAAAAAAAERVDDEAEEGEEGADGDEDNERQGASDAPPEWLNEDPSLMLDLAPLARSAAFSMAERERGAPNMPPRAMPPRALGALPPGLGDWSGASVARGAPTSLSLIHI